VVGEVTTLAHEVGNDAVEARALETKSLFASAKRAEVLACLWHPAYMQKRESGWLNANTQAEESTKAYESTTSFSKKWAGMKGHSRLVLERHGDAARRGTAHGNVEVNLLLTTDTTRVLLSATAERARKVHKREETSFLPLNTLHRSNSYCIQGALHMSPQLWWPAERS